MSIEAVVSRIATSRIMTANSSALIQFFGRRRDLTLSVDE